ncbi:hypothetical protein D3C77_568410 [compost metagenome]
MAERRDGAPGHFGHHRVDCDGFFQLVVLHQAEAVEGHSFERLGLADLILVERGEGFEQLMQEAALDGATLHAQVAHGFEEGVLFGIAGGAVSDLE